MARYGKKVLLGMTANEKKFMRKIVGVLEKNSVHKSEWKERKIEALEDYRIKVRKVCSQCFTEVIDSEILRLTPSR